MKLWKKLVLVFASVSIYTQVIADVPEELKQHIITHHDATAARSLQSALQRRQAVVHAGLRADVVHAWRDRVYRAIAGSTWVYYSRNRASAFGPRNPLEGVA